MDHDVVRENVFLLAKTASSAVRVLKANLGDVHFFFFRR